MSDLDALLAGIVAHPHEHVRWLIVADWLDDHGFADRAELLRLHRMMIDTCCEPDAHPERAAWQARIVELIDHGVTPCVPQHTLMLPGGVPLVGNFIPPGSFLMGSVTGGWENVVHMVTLTRGFFMGICPVTQAQWKSVMKADPSSIKGDDRPVESMSLDHAITFCGKVAKKAGCSVRLPTEAQWEYACRAGTTTQFHFGDVPDANRMNYDGTSVWNGSAKGRSRMRQTVAGTFASNPWGLFDCHGNVWEWCSDRFDAEYFANLPRTDPESHNEELPCHSLRGGSWQTRPQHCVASSRNFGVPDTRCNVYGFRVVFTLS